MSKAILVIDMPSKCGECSICSSYAESAFSPREYWCAYSDSGYVNPDSKPDWCPLIPIPEKHEIDESKYNDRPRPNILGGT